MKDQLQKKFPQAPLYVLAQRLLRDHNNPVVACESFMNAVLADPALAVALWRSVPDALRGESLKFLRTVAEDMSGPEATPVLTPKGRLPSPDRTETGGQIWNDAQRRLAAAPSPNSKEAMTEVTPSPSLPPAPSRAGGGHLTPDTQRISAAAPREPSAAYKAAAKKGAKELAASIHDTFTITMRQGSRMPVGEIRVGSYDRLIRQIGRRSWVSSREYNLLTLLKQHKSKQAYVPKDAKTRDIISDQEIAALIDIATNLATPQIGRESANV